MKFTVTRKEEIDVTHVEFSAQVRYWEDAEVNGEQDDEDNPRIPGRDGDMWRGKMNLEEGRIEDWPEGTTAKVHYKVCDAGEYWLLDAAGNRVAHKADYVPSALCHGDNGYGDYIIMDIGSDGKIASYRKPNLAEYWNDGEED